MKVLGSTTLVCALLGVSACGGDGAADGSTALEDSATSPELGTSEQDRTSGDAENLDPVATKITVGSVVSTAFGITDRLGGEGAFAAIVVALDRGYSLPQVLDASEGLDAEAWITVDGTRVQPNGSPLGLVGPAPSVDEETLGAGQPLGFRRAQPQRSSEQDEYVAFVGETLGEMWARIQIRAKWDLPGEKVDEIVDGVLERQRIDAEFDALFAEDPDELESLAESEAFAVALTMLLVGQGYSLEDALVAALSGTFDADGVCLFIPGAVPATELRILGCPPAVNETAATTVDPTEDEPATTVAQDGSTEGAWTGSGTSTNSSESLSSTRTGSAVVELRDGIYTLSFEMESQSTIFGHDECSTTTSAFGQIGGTPDEYGKILFVAEVTTDIVSGCKFYESSGGVATETNEFTFVGQRRDDGVFELRNLLPDSSVELVWTSL